jgi:ribosomal RNA-processing protein 8
LKNEIENKVYSFDYVAIDESVISCDISNVPLNDESIDIGVFCLSLMGNNWKDYIKESKRLLRTWGKLMIAEPTKKWDGRIEELLEYIFSLDFTLIEQTPNDKFFYLIFEKN